MLDSSQQVNSQKLVANTTRYGTVQRFRQGNDHLPTFGDRHYTSLNSGAADSNSRSLENEQYTLLHRFATIHTLRFPNGIKDLHNTINFRILHFVEHSHASQEDHHRPRGRISRSWFGFAGCK